MDTDTQKLNLTEKEKEDLLKEILGAEYSKIGNNLPLLKNTIDIVSHLDSSLTLTQLVPYFNTILSSSRLIGAVSAGASIFSIFLFPVSTMISIINAYQVGHTMYAYRAIAYTLTAWAFNKPLLGSSNKILLNIREGGVVANVRAKDEYKKVWEKTSRTVLSKVTTELSTKGIPDDALKILLRAAANNSEQKLCELIMVGFEDKMSLITRMTWKSNYSIKYPN